MTGIRELSGGIASLANNVLTRFPPAPKSRNGLSFAGVLQGVGSALNTTTAALAGGIDPMYMDLISQQIQAQQQMQLVSFISNIEKSKHETQMAAIRNVRVG